MKLLVFSALCLSALCPAGLAGAATVMPTHDQIGRFLDTFDAADGNHDGFVTRTEWLDYRAQQFARFDRNCDGFLSSDDAPRWLIRTGANLQTAIDAFDGNHDSRIGRDEWLNGPAPAFDSVDTDRNGVIDALEKKRARAARP